MTRHVFLLFHRYIGLLMAVFLIIAGVTGSAIAFYDELDAGLNPTLYQVEPPGTPPLSLDEIARKIDQQYLQGNAFIRYTKFPEKDDIAIRFYLLANHDPSTGEPYPLAFNWIFANPYTGEVLGTRTFGAWKLDSAHIMPLLWELHYSLTLPWPYGEWIFGAVALLWTLDCCMAVYLTFPRSRRKFFRQWPKAWSVNLRVGAARAIRDSHIAFSLWLWGMLFMLAVSGVMFNLNHQVYQPVLSKIVDYEHVHDTLPEATAEQRQQRISLETARQKAREYLQDWQAENSFNVYEEDSLTLDMRKYAYRYKVKSALDLPASYAQTAIYLSAADGRFLARSHPRVDTGNFISTWLGALHMGRVFGAWYQWVMFFMGIVVTLVTVSGVMIWWRKRRSGKPKGHN
ncbi:PepSY-associated TM helix domain-containing protein [Teredinibacter turnerae]|uniref:PepSY-associated TM helix domain-containing protein n=1 Tax=Teredinibacter turnerae TaxID=2426 RepID=UPI00037DF919|nr:PepSY-associated TM helix domain-containing protein [Teredinibacter turnerae]